MVRRLLLLLLIGITATLTPAALASPPDQTWIPGLYDDADHDDAVLAVMATIASCERLAPTDPHVEGIIVALVSPIDEAVVPTGPPAARHTRAPPTS
jgi:hypothetical protein